MRWISSAMLQKKLQSSPWLRLAKLDSDITAAFQDELSTVITDDFLCGPRTTSDAAKALILDKPATSDQRDGGILELRV
jgi:hypothetical protein